MGSSGTEWQYHSRSDRHSKVACWGVLSDLLATSALLRDHVSDGKVVFGVNHSMHDFVNDQRKDLDLVIARPGEGKSTARHERSSNWVSTMAWSSTRTRTVS